MVRLLCIGFLLMIGFSCSSSPEGGQPEPHLELGQRISFVGADPGKTYIVAGYREQFEDKTDKVWNKQAYIVFTYFNDQDDFMQGVVHKNAILKQ